MKLKAHTAIFTNDSQNTLESILTDIFEKIPHAKSRVWEGAGSDNQQVTLAKFIRHPGNSGIAVVCSIYEKNSQKSTVSLKPSSSEADFGVQQAEDGAEFLDQNTVLFVVDDTVISCSIGTRAARICAAIHKIASTAGLIAPTNIFQLSDMPRGDILEMIHREGVKKVEFDATMLLGSLPRNIGKSLLESVFGEVATGEALKRRRENLAKLSISSRLFGRSATIDRSELDKKDWLSQVAESVIEEESFPDYTIFLGNDQEVKSGSLLRSKSVEIDKDGSSYNVENAYSEMRDFFNEVSLLQ